MTYFRGANILKAKNGKSPAHFASQKGFTKTLKTLFAVDSFLKDLQDDDGVSKSKIKMYEV